MNRQTFPIQTLTRSLPCRPHTIRLFSRLSAGGRKPHALLLESGETTTKSGEKSLIVSRSALHLVCRSRKVTVRALNANGCSLMPWLKEQVSLNALILEEGNDWFIAGFPSPSGGEEEARLLAPSPVDVLRILSRGLRSSGQIQDSFRQTLTVGTFSYDFLETLETLPPAREDLLDWPDFEFWLPDELIWVNHRTGATHVVCHVLASDEQSPLKNDAMDSVARLVAVVEAQEKSTDPRSGGETPGEIPCDFSDAGYAEVVWELQKHIVCGDVFQIVPSRTFSTPCSDPLAAFERLKQMNPSPYMFFLHGSQGILFGASPETALKVAGKTVEICPIAGTRARGVLPDGTLDPDLDSRLEAELHLNEKELAEHMMLVDLARNDVARVSVPGTRYVEALLKVVKYSHVMHLVSRVCGTLRPGFDALTAYLATMNMGTLVGAPKIKAAELLRKHEKTRRGPYGGAVGYLTSSGDFDSGIVIRSAVVKEGTAYIRSGAGVVFDSVPEAEAEETRNKAMAVIRAIHGGSRT